MRIALLTLIASVLFAAPAAATTVSLTSRYIEGYKGSGYSQDTVAVTGDPGEAHDLRVVVDKSGVTVTDAGAPVRVGAGCVALGDGASCPRVSTTIRTTVGAGEANDRVTLVGTGYVTADGGPGDDVLTAEGDIYATLQGGPGADRLTAGSVSALLDGGPGTDVELGGPSDDYAMQSDDDGSSDLIDLGDGAGNRLDYRGRHEPITVDLQAGIAGTIGERDVIAPGADWVQGGAGRNVLLGSDADEVLFASGAGRGAVIDGRGGDDSINGTTSADILIGGAGNDRVMTMGGGDRIDLGDGDDAVSLDDFGHLDPAVMCGTGQDYVFSDRVRPAVGVDCETVVFGGSTLSLAASPKRVTVDVLGHTNLYANDCALRARLSGRSRKAQVRQGRAAHVTVSTARDRLPATLSIRGSERCRHGRPTRLRKPVAIDLIETLPAVR